MLCALLAALAAAALAAPADSDLCKLSTSINGKRLDYDINILKRTNGDGPSNLHANWFAIETHDDEAAQDNIDDYTYFFNMCGPLLNVPSFLAARIAVFGTDVAVLQRVEDDVTDDDDSADTTDITDGYVLGRRQGSQGLHRLMDGDLRYTFAPAETHIPSPNAPGGWINTSRHCDSRQTTMLLFCADVGLGKPVFAYEGAQCDYVFVWNTCAACSLDDPIRQNCPGVTNICTNGSRAGKILLTLLLVLIVSYFVLGCLYKRFVSGARGWDQIPNADTWEYLIGLILDGIVFVMSIFKCCKPKPKPAPVKYQGLDDRNDDLDEDADDAVYDIGH